MSQAGSAAWSPKAAGDLGHCDVDDEQVEIGQHDASADDRQDLIGPGQTARNLAHVGSL
jgi:hypothetical protein